MGSAQTGEPLNVFNRFGIPWYQAVDGIGAVQMGYMRQFYEDNHFESMQPVAVASISPFGISADASNYPTMFDPLATVSTDKKVLLFIIMRIQEADAGLNI